ncbi:hypothetical protein GPX89_14645 [Nocardia sp. ET3-3]|uniref:Intracellular septation protein A n=1 Tax=Nocardia terrae TaxID=2675851 RepID=A0A7K1UVS4_9NOCA|nr:hypothetical protein [Nocardia terrae]MVU78480.1 hypothetical protein [Nocardia terrae]
MKIHSFVLGFLPWIVIIPFPSDKMGWGALLGFFVAVVQLGLNHRRGAPMDAMILDLGSAAFLLALSGLGFLAPHSGLIKANDVLSFTWLALIAFGSMAAGRPFTMGIARRQVPQNTWDSSDFRSTHMVITRIWGIAFAGLAIALGIVRIADLAIAAGLPVRLIGLSIPFLLTIREVKAIRARTTTTA